MPFSSYFFLVLEGALGTTYFYFDLGSYVPKKQQRFVAKSFLVEHKEMKKAYSTDIRDVLLVICVRSLLTAALSRSQA